LNLAAGVCADTKDNRDARANAKARLEAARKVYNGRYDRFTTGLPGENVSMADFLEVMHRWSLRWLEAEVELSEKKADQVKAAEDHLARMSKWEKLVQKMHKTAKSVSTVEVAATEFYRRDAEKRLRQIKK
jgi:hypothetical protein